METRTDILNELISLSPLVAGIKKVNLFTVPQGYFDSVSSTVLACLQEGHNIVSNSENKQTADVPKGYFDQLAVSILAKIKTGDNASEEIGNLSPLLYSLRDKNVFKVPEGYFDQLVAFILDKFKAGENASGEIRDLSPLLYSLRDKNVFEVPEGYFANVNKVIADKIKTGDSKEELKELSPLLYSIRDENVFEVPGNYFEALAGDILRKLKPVPAKVASMGARRFVKYAVAALFAGAMALGVYKSINPPSRGGDIEEQPSVATVLDPSIEQGRSMDEKQFNEALENLNDIDIAKYLETNGDVTDVATIKNNFEDVNLPSQDDYLLDETTLDKYLKEIEKPTVNN